MKKQSKEKTYFVDFEFKIKVTGTVKAKSDKDAKQKILESSQNPSFDDREECTMDCFDDLEFETCVEDIYD